jgi:hypothetical protein
MDKEKAMVQIPWQEIKSPSLAEIWTGHVIDANQKLARDQPEAGWEYLGAVRGDHGGVNIVLGRYEDGE